MKREFWPEGGLRNMWRTGVGKPPLDDDLWTRPPGWDVDSGEAASFPMWERTSYRAPTALEVQLAKRLSEVERKLACVRIWRLGDLKARISAVCSASSIAGEVLLELSDLLDRLHAIALEDGLHCLPSPQIEKNSEATVDIVWFDRRNDSALGVTILEPGASEGRVWLHFLRGQKSVDVYDPDDEVISDCLREFARA